MNERLSEAYLIHKITDFSMLYSEIMKETMEDEIDSELIKQYWDEVITIVDDLYPYKDDIKLDHSIIDKLLSFWMFCMSTRLKEIGIEIPEEKI